MPKDRTFGFNLTDVINLKIVLQKVKETIPREVLSFWTRALECLQKVHNDGFRICRCEAKNILWVNEKIKWVDSRMFDNITQSEPPVKNKKRLLDIIRLLLENSYVRHLSSQSKEPVKFYMTIYNMTKANIPELKHVIFFSRMFYF